MRLPGEVKSVDGDASAEVANGANSGQSEPNAGDSTQPWMRWTETDGHACTVSVVRLSEKLPTEAAAAVTESQARLIAESGGGTLSSTQPITDDAGVGVRFSYRLPSGTDESGSTTESAAQESDDATATGVIVDHVSLIDGEWQIDLSVTCGAELRKPAMVEAFLGSLERQASDRVARRNGSRDE